ncbi:MAG TPA: Ku protein [Polyangiaceae bacterium]|jgi:DNA end-binding protein Ku
MARAIWTGSISFGLVSIPVKLLPALRADEEVHFHYLHAKDQGRLRNVRKCEVCEKEISWGETVRGFEYEKGQYVVVDDAELKAMRPEATQSVDIRTFVAREEIDPMLFDTPYYLEPERKGRHAYGLLHDALVKTGRVGIAQVILRVRAHLAALSPHDGGLVLELLHYPHEVVPAPQVDAHPAANGKASSREMKAAEMLIDSMVQPFDPTEYKDDYEARLRAMLEARMRGEAPKRAKPAAVPATNVVDLAEVLTRSLAQHRAARPGPKKAAGARHAVRHARRAS